MAELEFSLTAPITVPSAGNQSLSGRDPLPVPPVALPTSLRSLFPPSTSSFHPDSPSILTRQSFFMPTLTSGQIRAESWLGEARNVALSPRGMGLLVGGTLIFQMGRAAVASQEIQMTFSALATTPRVSWVSAGLPLIPALAGCSGGGGGDADSGGWDARRPDGSIDGGMPRDNDGDGYNSNVDCNDMNANIHPLPAGGGVVTINTNTTVCPGIYHGLNLVIAPGTSGITVTGTGVTLNGDGSNRPAFELNTVNQSTIEGFNILNYPLGAAVILLNNAPNNTFRDMTVEAPQNRYAFYIDQSNGNTLRRMTINSHSDVGVYVNLSDTFTMTNSTITGVPPFDGVPANGLLTLNGGTGHRIDTTLFTGGSQFGAQLYNITNSMILNNRMMNCAGDGIKTSSMQNCTLSGNVVNGNQGWGLNLINASTPNSIMGNNFTMNTLGAVTNDASSSTGNTFSGNMPPP